MNLITINKAFIKRSFIMLILTCCVSKVHGQRDPYLRPFANNSIWNMAIHNNAVYVDAKINAPTAWGVTADPEIIILSPTSPNVGIFTSGWPASTRCDKGAQITSAPIPDGWINGIPQGTPNNSTAILAPDGQTIINLQCLHRCATTGPASSLVQYPSENLYGDGIEGGHGGSGMAALGGSIRVGELTPNLTEVQIKSDPSIYIKHVIKMNVNTALYVSKTNGGYRWPAVKADSNYNTSGACDYYGGSVPQFKMGSLLAIPKTVNVETMGLKTGPGVMMARTLQKYGAYLVDATCWDVVAFEIQTGPHGDVESQFQTKYGYPFSPQSTSAAWAQDVAKIVQELFVVDSNNADNIGGGPTTDLTNRLATAICDIGTPGSGIYDCGAVVNVPVTDVTVAPTTSNVSIGATTTLVASILPLNASNKSVSWTSSNNAVATVSTGGVVTAVAVGTATITVTTSDGNKTATSIVTVKTAVSSSKLTGTIIGTSGSWENNLAVTKDKAIDGNLTTYFDAATPDGNWVGLDLGTAQVISLVKYCPRLNWANRLNGGKIQGSNVANFSTATDLLTISVTPPVNALTSATINNTNAFRYVRYLSPTGGYGNIAEIEFHTPATSAPVAVTGVTLLPTSASVALNGTTNLTATVAPNDATEQTLSWVSSNTAIATVNAIGLVTGIAAGSATITVTTLDGNFTSSALITVNTAVSKSFKIMTLGDSKVEGGGIGGHFAWRGYLRSKLMQDGFTIDYVGPRSNAAPGDGVPNDLDHAGFGGYTIGPDSRKWCGTCETTGVFEHVEDYFAANNPDIVLVSLGINDFFDGGDHPVNYSVTAAQRYQDLVNKVLSIKPSVKIILGTIEPVKWDQSWGGNPSDNNLGALNAKIKAIADASTTDNIYFADIRNQFLTTYSATDFFDDLHLSQQGATKVANTWYGALLPVLNTNFTTSDYEAESGTYGGGGQTQSSSNASNGAIVGNLNAVGSFSQVSGVNGGSGGPASLVIRYSNGFSSTSTIGLYVNNTFIQNVSFPATGGWNTFGNATVNINLTSGTSNTIKLQIGSGNAAADIDKYTVTATTLGTDFLTSNLQKVVSIYPNPLSAGNLIISTPGESGNKLLNIYDAVGRKIYSQQLPTGSQYTIDLTKLNYKGVCLVEVSDNSSQVVKKLIIQ